VPVRRRQDRQAGVGNRANAPQHRGDEDTIFTKGNTRPGNVLPVDVFPALSLSPFFKSGIKIRVGKLQHERTGSASRRCATGSALANLSPLLSHNVGRPVSKIDQGILGPDGCELGIPEITRRALQRPIPLRLAQHQRIQHHQAHQHRRQQDCTPHSQTLPQFPTFGDVG
jgi:hypothetical protein